MKPASEEQQEFYIARKHHITIAVLHLMRPVLLRLCRISAYIQRRFFLYISRLFEMYAEMAYITDQADMGFFETFILQQGSVEKIIKDFEKRSATWKKETLIERMQGIEKASKPVDFEQINMQHSLDEKKKAVIAIVKNKDEIISSFGKRIAEHDHRFYSRIHALYTQLCDITNLRSPEEI